MRHVACKNRNNCLWDKCVIHSPKPEHDVKEVVTACARAELEDVNFGGTIEVDAHDIAQHEPGAKLDKGKPRVGMFFACFPDALLEVARVATFGAKKYSDFGWESVPNAIERYFDAECRHTLKVARGIYTKEFAKDEESGINELAHMVWNGLADLQKAIEYEREHKHE